MRVGFVGLGTQGKYLALNQVNAGFDLSVFDIRTEPLRELEIAGAIVAVSARALASSVDIIQVCVLDDAQLEGVMFGPDGLLEGAKAGTIIVVHSTVRPSTIDKINQQTIQRGIELLDVPVSGSESGARNKTMSYMVGGSEKCLAVCRPLFETSGDKIVHTGPVGTGIRTKLAHQLIVCVNLLAAYEGMKIGTVSGVPLEILRAAVSNGSAQSRLADKWGLLKFDPKARHVFSKDLAICLEYGRDLGLTLPATELAKERMDEILS